VSSSTPKPAAKPFDRRKRRCPRYRIDFRLKLNYLQGDYYQTIEGHSRNLSEAGIGMLLAAELSIGDVAALSLCFPKLASPLELRAVVRYRHGYQYGFEFLALTDEQRQALSEFLHGREEVD
jgi:c-di-GMP-binding flagellar brake protein YcgR